ncbi:SAV_2336 N-terminal domain-related protein [Streptomyces sp. NPDC059639]|uniref:SAV_2336 N-terminal domain-related protein n=1 Tax=Streptomyces sp. NPDC059639 TaxID=3346891 RepID=UPI0036C9B3F9
MPAARTAHDPGEEHRAGLLLTALAERLREAELDPGVVELADALWLAGHIDAGEQGRSREDSAKIPGATPDVGPAPVPGPLPPPPAQQQFSGEPSGLDVGGRLFAPSGDAAQSSGLRAVPVRVPAPPVLPDPVGLQRGLRPLQRYRAPVRASRTLDEQATAERAAQSGGLVVPVFSARRRREARLLLLMDLSTSTAVWREALDELRYVCERAGAFREVQVQYLYEDGDGRPGSAPTVGHFGRLRDPAQLTDPTGRQLTLLLSDCAGPMWRSGRMQQLLHRWARSAPVAVVQPLPQSMWQRTHLPARRGVLHRREGPAGRFEFAPDRGRPPVDALPVPVLALRRSSVEGWARLLSGATGQSLRTAAGWVGAVHPAAVSSVRAHQDVAARDRVRTFLHRATPPARRLAVSLTVVPLYLPVMRLMQHVVLAGSGPEVMAEVLLSGLLRRRDDAVDPDKVRYEFLPGVGRELRRHVDPQEAELLLGHCSEYVTRNFGHTARNFPALAASYLRGTVPPPGLDAPLNPLTEGRDEPPGLEAFAEVSLEVLRDLAPRVPLPPGAGPGVDVPLGYAELLELGREAEATYEQEGNVRELERAIELYREAGRAAGAAAEREAAEEQLGCALLRRAGQAGAPPESLLETLAVLRGVAQPSPRGRAYLGRTLLHLASAVNQKRLPAADLPQPLRDWAQDRATDDCPTEEWAQAKLLEEGAGELTAVQGEDHGHGDALGLLLAGACRLLALCHHVSGPDGHFRAARPRDWFTGQLERGLAVLEALPDNARVHEDRGDLRLMLAEFYDGQWLHDAEREPEDRLRALLNAGLARSQFESVLESSDGQHSETWLDLATALEILGEDPGAIDDALERALAVAQEEPEERVECLTRIARLRHDRFQESGEQADIDRAVTAWAQAAELLGPDDEERVDVLTDYGSALLHRALLPGAAAGQDIHTAVRVLREAVDATPGGDQRRPLRRTLLGQACIVRFQAQGVVTDLHEADWILAEAAREADSAGRLAPIWQMRGVVARLLAERTGRRDLTRQALRHVDTALEHAAEAGPDALRATHELRAHLLADLDRRAEAVAACREALALTEDIEERAELVAFLAELEAAPE